MKFSDQTPVTRDVLSLRATLFDSEYISAGQTFFRGDAEDNNRGASVTLGADRKWRKFGVELSLRDEYSATEQWNYLNGYEANMRWSPADLSVFSLGRKLDRWTEWEREWHQGVFQPRYMQNRLRSEEAGLTGLFYNQDTRPLALAVGFLPIAIPDLGARYTIEDERFVSKNPWFNPPAKQFEYRQVVSDIRYSVDTPTLEEAVLHPGGVGKLEFHSGSYFGRVSAAYKPMPQFLLGFPSRGRVMITPTEDYMSVRVTPRLAYHALFSHDSVVRARDWTLGASLTREVPSEDASPEDFTAQQVRPATIYSARISRTLEEDGPYAARVKLGFFKVEGGDARDKGDFAGATSMFERRYQYLEAYSLGFSKPWRGMGQFPLDTELRLIYDRIQNGGVANISIGMNFNRWLRADLEADFLGLFSGPAQVTDGFLALYRANDRVGFGVSYVY